MLLVRYDDFDGPISYEFIVTRSDKRMSLSRIIIISGTEGGRERNKNK